MNVPLARACCAALLLLACDGGGRFARLRFEVALSSDALCEPDSAMSIADQMPCTTVRVYREDGSRMVPVPLLRPGDDHATATGAVELRFADQTIEFDAQLASDQRHDLFVAVYAGRPSVPTWGARVQDLDPSREDVRVRLYPFATWSCPGRAEENPVSPRAFHQAIQVGNGDVLLLGGITSDGEIGPASAATPPRGRGGLLQPVVDVYDPAESRFHRVSVTDEEGFEGFGRVLFGAMYLGEAGDQRYRIRVIGGFGLDPSNDGTAVLNFDNSGFFAPLGAPFTPTSNAIIRNGADYIYDARERTLTWEAQFEPSTVPRGGGIVLSDPVADGTRAVLIGLSVGAFPAGQYYTFNGDTASRDIPLLHPRLGASIDAIPDMNVFLVWGGDLSDTMPMVLPMAGEILAQTGAVTVISSMGGALPRPVAFHTSTRVSADTVIIAGGIAIEDAGNLLVTQPDPPIFGLRVAPGPLVSQVAVDATGYRAGILHTATFIPGHGVLIAGGAVNDAGNRLVSVNSVGMLRPVAGGSFRFDDSVDDLTEPRFGHAATVLDGERVLITGGLGPSGMNLRPLALAEVLFFGQARVPTIADGACIDLPEDPPLDGGTDAGATVTMDAGMMAPLDAGMTP